MSPISLATQDSVAYDGGDWHSKDSPLMGAGGCLHKWDGAFPLSEEHDSGCDIHTVIANDHRPADARHVIPTHSAPRDRWPQQHYNWQVRGPLAVTGDALEGKSKEWWGRAFLLPSPLLQTVGPDPLWPLFQTRSQSKFVNYSGPAQ